MALGLWHVPEPRVAARRRLFVLHHAGGSAAAYAKWSRWIPKDTELHLLELPGRARRYGEPFYSDIGKLIEDLGTETQPRLDLPYILLGHSMGSLLGLELARWLQRRGCPPPQLLVASSFDAPTADLMRAREKVSHLGDDFVEKLSLYGELPDEIRRDEACLQFFLKIIRADIRLLESFAPADEKKITAPVIVLLGDRDRSLSPAGIQRWEQLTTGPVSTKVLPGGHFFIFDASEVALRYVFDAVDEG